jgi:DinB superfamily
MAVTEEVRKQLLAFLRGGNAHAAFDEVLKEFPAEKRGVKPAGLPYSAWQLLEHIRITQHDILRFSKNSDGQYHSPKWPEGYWPKSPDPPNDKAWDNSVAQVHADRKEFEELLTDGSDLETAFPWGDGQNLLREALLIADHTAYHLGEIVTVRRILGVWQR